MAPLIAPHSSLPDEIVAAVEGADYVSLDIFDTVLIRGCHHPADVFEIVGRSQAGRAIAEFKERRVRAERIARGIATGDGRREVTLQEIYDILQADAGLSSAESDHLRSLEVSTELALSGHSRFGRALVDLLISRGKRFVFTSDMYLPKDTVLKMLDKSGIEGFECLFLSSETGRTKHDGQMFKDVLDYFGARPTRVLHVGDNYLSDYVRPQEVGMRAYHRPALREQFERSELWNKVALFRGSSRHKLALNALYVETFSGDRGALEHIMTSEDSYWHALGWLVLAPLALSLCSWIDERRQRLALDKIVFLARDGQFVKRMFDVLYPDRRTSYMAASRRLLTVPNTILSPSEIRNYYGPLAGRLHTVGDFISAIPGGSSAKHRLRELGFDLDAPIRGRLESVVHALGENSGLLTNSLSSERDHLRSYLSAELGGHGSVGVFDLGWRGSMQAAIEATVPEIAESVVGLYFGTSHEAIKNLLERGSRYHSFSMSNGTPEWMRRGCQDNTDPIEFLFSADHGSVVGLKQNGETIEWEMAGISPNEQESQVVASKIQAGAMEALGAAMNAGLIDMLDYDRERVLADFLAFLNNPTPYDAKMFSDVRVFSGIGDTTGDKLSGRTKGRSLIHDMRHTRWQVGFERALNRPDQVLVRLLRWGYARSRIARYLWRRIARR